MEILFMSKVSRFSVILTNGTADHLKPWQIQTIGYSFVTHVGRAMRKRSGVLMILKKIRRNHINAIRVVPRSRTKMLVG